MHLTQGLHTSIQMTPDAVASIYRGRRRTYRELGDRVARLAAGLRGLGLGEGERIGMLALNSDRYQEYMLAGWWAGAVLNPVNYRWSVPEIVYSLDDCDTRFLIVDDQHLPLIEGILATAKHQPVLIHAGDGETPAGMHSFEQLIAESAPMEDSWRGGEDLAVIMYTGGTTGLPKGVMLTHRCLWSCALMRMTTCPVDRDSLVLITSPMFHVAGMGLVAQRLIAGAPNAYLPFYEVVEVLETIQRERITEAMLVPTMLQALLAHPKFAETDLSSLKRISYGAAPINAAVLERALELLPAGVEFTHAYGMTENCGPVTLNLHENHGPEGRASGLYRSAGRAIAGLQLKIADEQGQELPRGSVGEILLKGPSLMQGYWGKPEETAKALQNGWFSSGDAAYMDAQGYVFVVDRVKDMIVSGGENVYSAEVENVLAKHPAVALCAVIGIPHDTWGEAVHAVVTLKPGATLGADELRAHCREFIAGYKCPKSVEFRDTLPLSGAGKILKRDLREPFWKGKARAVN
ncbi:long-chain-fatty-acid--CoA ligase [Pseudomonas sp. UL073]|uniref:Long-chain-fatty-acid--CoA ligase n=1 Tax=Zestomonas insulae TaxID=2809017 RepID=A0ABS2IFL0_9GAMM|nr:long-chain-fatty-acid--CoA ligase [Pseudomonas insulae]MBM7061876.1 long-chain-fatty-acid--CoA ligase [Pseudomonas insulae]